MSTYSESYWKRREEADDERESPHGIESAEGARVAAPMAVDETPELWDSEVGEPVQSLAGKPEFGPVEPPPPTPEAEADWSPFAPTPGATPAAAAKPTAPDNKALRLDAIRRIRELSDAPNETPEGLRDADIAAATERDRSQVRRDNFTEALSAAIARRPARLQQTPEAPSLLQRRAMADSKAAQSLNRKMTAEEKIAAVLKGEKVEGMTPYQVEQIKQGAIDRERRRLDKEEADKRHNEERKENNAFREQSHQDAVAQQKATLRLAESQFNYKKGHDEDEDVKDLGKTLGDDPVRMMGLVEKLEQDSKSSDIPGVGPLDKFVPDVAVGDEGLRIRNDMREAVRAMLTMKSGKTVTPQEAQDYAKIYGIDGTEEAFREGIRRLRADMAQTIATKKAGFRPDVVETYEQRGGAKTPDMPKPRAPQPKRPSDVPADAKRIGNTWQWRAPNGRIMVVED